MGASAAPAAPISGKPELLPLAPPVAVPPPLPSLAGVVGFGESLVPESTQNGGTYLPSMAAWRAVAMSQSFQEATEP